MLFLKVQYAFPFVKNLNIWTIISYINSKLDSNVINRGQMLKFTSTTFQFLNKVILVFFLVHKKVVLF